MNVRMTVKEVMTVKEGRLTSCCNEYLPRAVMTKEMNNECRNDWQGMIVKEGKMIEGMNQEGMNGKE